MRNGLVWRMLAASASCAALAGCDLGLIYRGQPDYAFAGGLSGVTPAPASTSMRDTTQIDDVIGTCKGKDAKAVDCYWPAKNVFDYQYQVYKTNLLHAVNFGTAFGDFTVLALNTAGAVTPGAAAAKLFNALAAGATGTKTIISQDVLYKQTVTILISEMDSDRSAIAKANEAALLKTPTPTAAQAINGLLAYYEAGTFQHALVTLANKAGTDTSKSAQTTTTQTDIVTFTAANPADCSKSSFELKGTVGITAIDATLTPASITKGAKPTLGDAVSQFAKLKTFSDNKITATADTTKNTVTLSYTADSDAIWLALSPGSCTFSVAPQVAAK